MGRYGPYTHDLGTPERQRGPYEAGANKELVKCPRCGKQTYVKRGWTAFTCFECGHMQVRDRFETKDLPTYKLVTWGYFYAIYSVMEYPKLKETFTQIPISEEEWNALSEHDKTAYILEWLNPGWPNG